MGKLLIDVAMMSGRDVDGCSDRGEFGLRARGGQAL
jgi:hypothetical protein